MTRRCFVSMVLGMALAAFLSLPASAQGMDKKEVFATVSFGFYVGDTSFPAGSYVISAANIGAESVSIRPSAGKDATTVPVITRLARQPGEAKAKSTDLVFDTVGDKKYLSEVWIAGREGYLVRATKEAHEHVLVNATK